MTPVEQWNQYYLEAKVDVDIEIEEWLVQLVTMGYTRSQMVTTPGEFALRGGILDIYPPYAESPIRIELFDTVVDSIRTFSADDQRSIEKLNHVQILPATELLLTEKQRVELAERLETALSRTLKKLKSRKFKKRFIKISSTILKC